MFETLFKYPRVIARHRMGPSAEARERFLKHCSGQGLAGATLLRHARELLVIAERIDITIGETIGLPAIETAADCWDREQHDRHRAQAVGWSRKLFVQTAYIAGTGPVTRFWHRKHEVLRGFYRFAMARGYTGSSPLPKIVPKAPHFVPHIYSQNELQRLLDATVCCEGPRCKLQPHTCRMLILLLYGAGLRISEALSLRLTDVDLSAGILTIRESKFYKTRLVPMSPALNGALGEYVAQRAKNHPDSLNAALFLTRTGTPVARHTAENVFSRLRVRAGVLRDDGCRYQPRLHDLRHAFAVHRLVSWYRQGADVQRLLPQLATYLGHVHIAATQRYLTLTPELLHQASQRFERYAREGQHG